MLLPQDVRETLKEVARMIEQKQYRWAANRLASGFSWYKMPGWSDTFSRWYNVLSQQGQ